MAEYLNRESILEEALRVFARHGFRKASLNDIVRGLGVGKSAIYHHFPGGKGEIVDACLQREEEAVIAEMRAAVEGHRDPRLQLRAMVAAKLEHITRLRDVLAISGEVGRELAQLYRRHERRFTLHEESLIESILRRGQETGHFRTADPQRLAGHLRTLLGPLELEIAFDPDDSRHQATLDAVFELLFYGLVAADHPIGRPS